MTKRNLLNKNTLTKLKQDIGYDAYLNWNLSTRCNFECDYCFHNLEERKSTPIKPVDIEKVLQTLKKTGKKYIITLSGGEPFLIPNFIELCKALTKEHYIGIVTNLSCTDALKEFIRQIPPEKVLNIHASCHVSEYKKKKIDGDFFIKNYNLLKQHNFKVNASYLVYPSLISRFEKDILYYRLHGVDIYSRLFIGTYQNKNYPQSYNKKEQKKILKYHLCGKGETVFLKDTLCNAGYNAAIVNPDGNVFACCSLPLKLGNIFEEIKFNEKILRCPVESCICPFKIYQPSLFNNACKTTTVYSFFQQKFLLAKVMRYKKLKSDFIYLIHTPERLLGKFGIFLRKYNPNLYHKLKKIEKKIRR